MVDKALLEAFSGVKNALVAGFVWIVGLYLLVAHTFPWWVSPLTQAAPPVKVVVDALGVGGITAAALLFMTLIGDGLVRMSTLVWSKAHRIILMFVLKDVSTPQDVRSALRRLTWLGSRTRSYSNRALTRLIEEFHRQRENANLEAATPAEIRTLASNVIFMAPSLLSMSEKRFAEQQRHTSRFELACVLIVGMPVLIIGTTVTLHVPWPGIGVAAAVFVFAYTIVEAGNAWRDSNSQIAHALADQNFDFRGISQNWDVSRGVQVWLPQPVGRWFLRSLPPTPEGRFDG